MKRYIALLGMLLLVFIANSQTEDSELTLFAQGHFVIDDREALNVLQTELRMHPYIKVVRLDWDSQRLFILTRNISSLEKEELSSWLGKYAETLSCVQIGIYGVDKVNRYPFQNCAEDE